MHELAKLALSWAARFVPATQFLQKPLPLASWYLPTSHRVQLLS
jgi:hypothetical protein